MSTMTDISVAPSAQEGEETVDEAIKRWKAWQKRMLYITPNCPEQRLIVANNNTTTSTTKAASKQGTTVASSSLTAGSVTQFFMLPPTMIPLPKNVGSGSRFRSPNVSMPSLPVMVPARSGSGSHPHNPYASMPSPRITAHTGPNLRRHSKSSSDPVVWRMAPPARMTTPLRQRLLDRIVIKLASVPALPPRVRSPRTLEAAETMIFLATGTHPPIPPPAPTPPPPRRNTSLLRPKKVPATMPKSNSNYLFQVTVINNAFAGRSLSHQRLLSLPKNTKVADLFILMGILFHHTDDTAWTRVHIKIDRPKVWREPPEAAYRTGKLLCDSSKIGRGPHETIGDLDDPDYAGYVLWVVLRIYDSDGVDHQGNRKFKSETEDVSHLMQLIGRATGPPGKISCLGGTGESKDDDTPPYVAGHDNDRLVECFGDAGAERFVPEHALEL